MIRYEEIVRRPLTYTLRQQMLETHLCELCYKVNQVRGFCHLATFRLSGKQEMGKTGKFLKPAYNDLPKPVPGVSFKKGS